MTQLTTPQMKKLARDYYSRISNNEILSVRKAKKFPNSIALKVYNPIFKSTGIIWICFNNGVMALTSEIGVHGTMTYKTPNK